MLAKQMSANCLPSHEWLIYQFNRAVNREKCSSSLNSEPQGNNRQQAVMQNWKYKCSWNTAYVTFSCQEPTENLTTLISSYNDSALEFWWQSLTALMLDALAFICREHPRGFYYILVNLKQKEDSKKELKTALQYTVPSKEPPAIRTIFFATT